MSMFEARPFTNSLGQELNPGDDVVYVGSGYNHSVRINKGKFAGVYLNDSVWSIEQKKYVTGVSAIKIEGVPDRKFVYDYDTKKGEYKDIIRTATLPLKRAFRIDLPLSALSGQNLGS